MHKNILVTLWLVFVIAGCSGKSSDELYAEGTKELQHGNARSAIVLFRNALEKNQNHLDARYQLAKAYMSTGKFDMAEKEFQKVQRQNPLHPDIKLDLAKLYNSLKKPDTAIALASEYLSSKPGSADALETLGRAYIGKKMLDNAEAYLLKALEQDPGKSSAKLALASLYHEQGSVEKAKALLEGIIKGEPGNTAAYNLLAEIEIAQGAQEKALQIYKILGDIQKSSPSPHYKSALIYLDMGNVATAEKIAEGLIKAFPKQAEGYRLKGIVCFQRHNFPEAISALQNSLKLQPNLAGYFFLGLSLYNQGELENALSQFRIILDKAPSFTKARLLSAMILLQQKRADDAIAEINRLLETDSKNALAYNVLGSAYMSKGMYDEGIRELNRATELDPKIIDAHLKKGIYHLRQGKVNEGEADLYTAVKVAPEILNTRFLVASYYMQKNNHAKALSVLNEGLTGKKNDAALYTCMAKIMFADKKGAQGVQYLRKAKDSDPGSLDPYFTLAAYYAVSGSDDKALNEYYAVLEKDSVNVKAMLRIAELMELRGRDNEAVSFYLKAKETRNPAAYMALANYYVKKNDPKKALSILAEANSYIPRNTAILEMRGLLQMKEKQYKEALKTFDDIEQIVPEYGIPLKINAYLAMNEPNDAVKEARRAITLKPNSPRGYLLLASVYRQQKKPERAIEELKNGLRVDSRSAQTAIMLAELYGETGNYSLAMKTCEDIVRKSPDFAPAYFTQGVLLERIGDKKEAAKKYLNALTIANNYMPALNNLAILYADGYGNKHDAIRLAEAALALQPDNPGVMDTLGYALLKNGRIEEARSTLEKAARILPYNPAVNYHLALAYKESGNKERAVSMLQKALRSADFTEAPQAKILLTELN